MLIGILQAGHLPEDIIETWGDYPEVYAKFLDGQGLEFRAWPVVDMEFPNSIDAADGWLITGSRHGAYEDHPWIDPLEHFIQAAFAARKPMVGICFGHQIIAQALGGKVEKSPKGWGVGRMYYAFGEEELALNAWHQDQITQKPEAAQVVAASPFCEFAGLLYGDQAFSVQPHPEFTSPFTADLMDSRGGAIPPERLAVARSNVDQPVDQARLATMIGDFFKMPRPTNA